MQFKRRRDRQLIATQHATMRIIHICGRTSTTISSMHNDTENTSAKFSKDYAKPNAHEYPCLLLRRGGRSGLSFECVSGRHRGCMAVGCGNPAGWRAFQVRRLVVRDRTSCRLCVNSLGDSTLEFPLTSADIWMNWDMCPWMSGLFLGGASPNPNRAYKNVT